MDNIQKTFVFAPHNSMEYDRMFKPCFCKQEKLQLLE